MWSWQRGAHSARMVAVAHRGAVMTMLAWVGRQQDIALCRMLAAWSCRSWQSRERTPVTRGRPTNGSVHAPSNSSEPATLRGHGRGTEEEATLLPEEQRHTEPESLNSSFTSSSTLAGDYYAVLGVSKQATLEQIKKAYKKKSLEHHPDKGGDPQHFNAVSKAYETLSNPQKRAAYARARRPRVRESHEEERCQACIIS